MFIEVFNYSIVINKTYENIFNRIFWIHWISFIKKLLDKGHSVHGFDSVNNYYDVKLKKARYQILNKYKKFSFTKGKLQNQKTLKQFNFKI